jgi:bifunctional DNA-binding transcriptional regulator/antitoxin component of YhaV-PrlF toxin-antitoxin module
LKLKVIVNNGQYKITIPKELALEKGWNSKTRLRFVEDSAGNIILKEVKLSAKK